MSSEKSVAKKAYEDLPEEFRRMNVHSPPKGNIPLSFIFEGIYQRAASGKANKVAPQEVIQLKLHLDGAIEQLQIIARKLREKDEEESK